jgi:Ca2+-binding EF-hand superfamily protein
MRGGGNFPSDSVQAYPDEESVKEAEKLKRDARAKRKELSDDQLEEVKQIFFLYDADGSGSIGIAELFEALGSVGLSQDELVELFHKYDADGNGMISLEEFVEMMRETFH